MDVVHIWKEIGLALGLKQPTLERIKSYYHQHSDCCLTEAIAAWLNGEDRPHDSPGPNWGEVLTALKSVNKKDQAHQLLLKLKGMFKRVIWGGGMSWGKMNEGTLLVRSASEACILIIA